MKRIMWHAAYLVGVRVSVFLIASTVFHLVGFHAAYIQG